MGLGKEGIQNKINQTEDWTNNYYETKFFANGKTITYVVMGDKNDNYSACYYAKLNDLLLFSDYAKGNLKLDKLINSSLTFPNIAYIVVKNDNSGIYIRITKDNLDSLAKSYTRVARVKETILSLFDSNSLISLNEVKQSNNNIRLNDVINSFTSKTQELIDINRQLVEENLKMKRILNNIAMATQEYIE